MIQTLKYNFFNDLSNLLVRKWAARCAAEIVNETLLFDFGERRGMKRVDADFARVIAFRVDDESFFEVLVNVIGCVHVGCNGHWSKNATFEFQV